MKADRAVDLSLVREHRQPIEAGGCAPPILVLSDRVQDQRTADRMREQNHRASFGLSTPDEPTDAEWQGTKL